jgi:hypothetical protein
MNERTFGRIALDPSRNPAVLDTLTWDADAFVRRAAALSPAFWEKAGADIRAGLQPPSAPGLALHGRSVCEDGGCRYILAEAEDGQHSVVEFARGTPGSLPEQPLHRLACTDGGQVLFHESSSRNVHAAWFHAAPDRLPRAQRLTAKIGVGTRMSKTQWPGIWKAVDEGSFAVNGIQNSQRELNLLEDILNGQVPKKLYYPGIGFVPEGHTGSTFEGLWLCGVSEALKAGTVRRYGADADHIMVKRGPEGLERARKVLLAARYYSFFTIDVSDVLDYAVYREGAPAPSIEDIIPDVKTRGEVLSWYRSRKKGGSSALDLDDAELARLVGKYWRAVESVDSLVPYIRSLRGDEPFDLELSIDEHPPEIHPFECLTSEREVAFLLAETERRGLPVSHIAPNLGVEKHVDYRYHDGLEGLERRTRALHQLALDHGVMIDCHSGDNLSAQTRRALRRATGGLIHYKISPCLQTLFGEVLFDFDPRLFSLWWDDAIEFARENAREGSKLASECINEYESRPEGKPDPHSRLFHLFGYATVGKRDERGSYLYRDRFYTLPREFHAEYSQRVSGSLLTFAEDLFGSPGT